MFLDVTMGIITFCVLHNYYIWQFSIETNWHFVITCTSSFQGWTVSQHSQKRSCLGLIYPETKLSSVYFDGNCQAKFLLRFIFTFEVKWITTFLNQSVESRFWPIFDVLITLYYCFNKSYSLIWPLISVSDKISDFLLLNTLIP